MGHDRIIKGSLIPIILKLLDNNGKMYGYEIARAVEAATKGRMKVTEAALYPALHKLEDNNWVAVQERTVENRHRRYYRLNRKGKKEARSQEENLKASISDLHRILRYQIPPV